MAGNVAPNIIDNGLVLYLDAANTKSYPTTGTTWNDLSRSGNTGTLTNGPTYSSLNSGSIVFDGINDYISTNTNSSLTQAGSIQFTAEFWVLKSASDKDMLMGAYNASDGKGWFLQWYLDGYVYFGIRNGGGSNYNYFLLTYQNKWFHIVGVFDGSQPTDATKNKIYINGVQQTLTTLSQLTSVPIGLVQLTIGSLTNYSSYSSGNISSVKIYNRALTSTEVLQNYNSTKSRFGL